jgi:hypothetical protein
MVLPYIRSLHYHFPQSCEWRGIRVGLRGIALTNSKSWIRVPGRLHENELAKAAALHTCIEQSMIREQRSTADVSKQ